jgi:hypothetical protein
MRFLYKINSGYDRFTPARISERLVNKNQLRLGWERYIEQVSKGDEVWIYFCGPHRFTPGVYAKGIVRTISPTDPGGPAVYVKLTELDATKLVTDDKTSERVAKAVDTWFTQVFLFPEDWNIEDECQLQSSAESCQKRLCGQCGAWKRLPRIRQNNNPERMGYGFSVFAPAYWVIPRRCYLADSQIKPEVRRTSELFYRFKSGEKALAFPLALGVFEALKKRKAFEDGEFDCIVPIPLSPDKAKNGEIHRTKLLASELAKLIGVPVLELLTLNKPVSKGRMIRDWPNAVEEQYYPCLEVSEKVKDYSQFLLVDDVSTRGSTLKCARRKIVECHPDPSKLKIAAATAGQMILTSTVSDESELRPSN